MEKKSLGRGLEDISNIFLSKRDNQQPDKIHNGFSSVKIRDETCDQCMNRMISAEGEQQCRIFSQDHDKYDVPRMDSIISNYGRFCVYFSAITPDPLEHHVKDENKGPDTPEAACEIEETIHIGRKIAFSSSDGSQKNIRKTLFEYLEEGYTIQHIELRKTYTVSEPRKKEKMDVEVVMYLK